MQGRQLNTFYAEALFQNSIGFRIFRGSPIGFSGSEMKFIERPGTGNRRERDVGFLV